MYKSQLIRHILIFLIWAYPFQMYAQPKGGAKLIVRGDDIGFAQSANEAILTASLEGIQRRTAPGRGRRRTPRRGGAAARPGTGRPVPRRPPPGSAGRQGCRRRCGRVLALGSRRSRSLLGSGVRGGGRRPSSIGVAEPAAGSPGGARRRPVPGPGRGAGLSGARCRCRGCCWAGSPRAARRGGR